MFTNTSVLFPNEFEFIQRNATDNFLSWLLTHMMMVTLLIVTSTNDVQ